MRIYWLLIIALLIASRAGAACYWGVEYEGEALMVGPYACAWDCADMAGSAQNAHPWLCHITGLPQDCGVIGKGFMWPQVPLDITPINCERMVGPNESGWAFLYYSLTNGPELIHARRLARCRQLYAQYKEQAALTPGDEIAYYSDARCPGAPCFSVGWDTACE